MRYLNNCLNINLRIMRSYIFIAKRGMKEKFPCSGCNTEILPAYRPLSTEVWAEISKSWFLLGGLA